MEYDLGWMPHIEGNWTSSYGRAYDPMSIVNHNGAAYISKVETPLTIEPGVTSGWANYWQLFATGTQGAAGQDGTQGIQGTMGVQGSIGSQGSTGAQGTQGYKGDNGVGSSIWTTNLTVRTDIDAIVAMSDMSGGNAPKPVVNDYLIDIKGNLFIVIALEGTNCKVKYIMPLRDGERGAQGVQGVQGVIGTQGVQGSIGAQGTAPANTETFTFEMVNGTTVTKTFYIIP